MREPNDDESGRELGSAAAEANDTTSDIYPAKQLQLNLGDRSGVVGCLFMDVGSGILVLVLMVVLRLGTIISGQPDSGILLPFAILGWVAKWIVTLVGGSITLTLVVASIFLLFVSRKSSPHVILGAIVFLVFTALLAISTAAILGL